jgi:hypothetical protein
VNYCLKTWTSPSDNSILNANKIKTSRSVVKIKYRIIA